MARLKEPSVRARKFIRNKIAGMSDTQAALAAGYSKSTATHAAEDILGNPLVYQEFLTLMEKQGITDQMLNQRLMEGLESSRIYGTGDNFIEIADYATRHKYLETAYKLKNRFPAQKVDVAIGGKSTIERWKKEMGLDEELRSLQKVSEGDVPTESVPVPTGDQPSDSESPAA